MGVVSAHDLAASAVIAEWSAVLIEAAARIRVAAIGVSGGIGKSAGQDVAGNGCGGRRYKQAVNGCQVDAEIVPVFGGITADGVAAADDAGAVGVIAARAVVGKQAIAHAEDRRRWEAAESVGGLSAGGGPLVQTVWIVLGHDRLAFDDVLIEESGDGPKGIDFRHACDEQIAFAGGLLLRRILRIGPADAGVKKVFAQEAVGRGASDLEARLIDDDVRGNICTEGIPDANQFGFGVRTVGIGWINRDADETAAGRFDLADFFDQGRVGAGYDAVGEAQFDAELVPDFLAADRLAGADLFGASAIGTSRIVVGHEAVGSWWIELVFAQAVSCIRTGIRCERNTDVFGDVHTACIPQVITAEWVIVADHLATDGIIAADGIFKIGVAGVEAVAKIRRATDAQELRVLIARGFVRVVVGVFILAEAIAVQNDAVEDLPVEFIDFAVVVEICTEVLGDLGFVDHEDEAVILIQEGIAVEVAAALAAFDPALGLAGRVGALGVGLRADCCDQKESGKSHQLRKEAGKGRAKGHPNHAGTPLPPSGLGRR